MRRGGRSGRVGGGDRKRAFCPSRKSECCLPPAEPPALSRWWRVPSTRLQPGSQSMTQSRLEGEGRVTLPHTPPVSKVTSGSRFCDLVHGTCHLWSRLSSCLMARAGARLVAQGHMMAVAVRGRLVGAVVCPLGSRSVCLASRVTQLFKIHFHVLSVEGPAAGKRPWTAVLVCSLPTLGGGGRARDRRSLPVGLGRLKQQAMPSQALSRCLASES